MRKIAYACCAQFPDVFEDDALARPFLAARGIEVAGFPWDAPGVPWGEFAAVVIRSTWDYHRRLGAFEGWIAGLRAAGVRLFNPPEVLLWNTRKTYLRELEARGVPIVPTLVVEPEAASSLPERIRELDAAEVVVKPAVSAGAHGLVRVRREEAEARRAELSGLAAHGTLLVQPFLGEIVAEGEWSVLYFGGQPSHAILKAPKPGEFRVQLQYGGRTRLEAPPPEVLRAAEAVLAAAPGPTLYARVDLIRAGGRVLLGELEVLEPLLFLGYDPLAPARFAAALDRAIR